MLWAKSKPRHPLWKHLLDVAGVAAVLPFPMKEEGWARDLIGFIAGCHDIGKSDFYFQSRVPEIFKEFLDEKGWKTGDPRCRHERLSARFLREWLQERQADEYTADALSTCILSHHGHWDQVSRSVGKKYAEAQNELAQMVFQVLGSPPVPTQKIQNLSAFGICLSGHIVLSDWIASNEEFFTDPRLKNSDDPQEYFKTVLHVASDWVHNLSFDRSSDPGKPDRIVKTPRPIQELLLREDIPPSLVLIEAPMGEGKTEAAWILAEKWRGPDCSGMYMALPTMATSDSLFLRYRDDYLGGIGGVKLVHGMAWLRDDKEPQKPLETGEPGDDSSIADAWFRPTRRAMLAEHGVGTIDQAMLAGMNAKFGFLRLYGLKNRVLVIDEVHAYDAYMSAIICRLLQWCSSLGVPVILLSATLSSIQRRQMIEAYGASDVSAETQTPYPLVTVAEPGKEVRSLSTVASMARTLRIELLPGFLGDAGKTAEKARHLVQNGGCCCVIVNTVRQAQAVYRELDLPHEEKMLFHARFTAFDRQRITERVLELFGKDTSKRPEKFVLVATQVVEQSLDVDFDSMISEIAPIDLLLQRSGRQHRHRRRDSDPVLFVLAPDVCPGKELVFGGTGFVYAKKPLLRTLALLSERKELSLPGDFRVAIERCYGKEMWQQGVLHWELIENADLEWEKETSSLQSEASKFALRSPDIRFFRPVQNEPVGDDSDDGNGWRAKTRLGANDRTACLVGESQIGFLAGGDISMARVREIYKQTVKLPSYLPVFTPRDGFSSAVEAKGKLRGLLLLPLNHDGIWQGEVKGKPFQVSYHNELGLLAGRVE
jgi:CRISPR-associated endonuclease/helicase Cas3